MKALLISSSAGTGKTSQVAKSVKEHHVNARVVTGNLRLAQELANDHGYALIQGRNQSNCQRHDVVRALGDAGHDVEALACGKPDKPRCRFREGCEYWQQFQQPGSWVAATEQLFNRHFLSGGGLVVVDDGDLSRALIDKVALTGEEISGAIKSLKGKRRVPLRELLAAVGHTILEAPVRRDGTPELLTGPATWDLLVHSARANGHDFEALVQGFATSRTTLPGPRADADGEVSREAVEQAPPATLLVLIRALVDELPYFQTGLDFNSRLRLSRDGIEVRRLKDAVRDRWATPVIGQLSLLVIDATPVHPLVDHLMRHHERLPDVDASVRMPENVRVVQYASSTNGHTVLRDQRRIDDVVTELSAERQRWPVADAAKEGVVCFKALKATMVKAGIQESQVVTFGSVRGTNALANVERLHVVGRPMPPGDELVYLAQVIHFGEAPVSPGIVLRSQAFGGQAYAIDVVDFGDSRVAVLLKASREDEIIQAIHRGRLFSLEQPRLRLVDEADGGGRQELRLVLHTSHPIPGLKVDELIFTSTARDVNSDRQQDAAARIRSAMSKLQEFGTPLTDAAIAREAGSDRRTVAKARREAVYTPKEDLLNKGVHTLSRDGSSPPPDSESVAQSPPAQPNLCRGGCGKPMPEGQSCFACAARKAEEWARHRKTRRRI